MAVKTASSISRRRFLKAAGTTALAVGVGPAFIVPGRTQPQTLKILSARYFRPGMAEVLENYAKAWGEKNDVRVLINFVKQRNVGGLMAADAAAGQGHDIVAQSGESMRFEDQFIDHRELFQECEHRYGRAPDFAVKMMSNRENGKLFKLAFCFSPSPVNYRKDLWDAVGMVPDTWENVRLGGRKIKFLHDKPIGISLASTLSWDGLFALSTILNAFGATLQNDQNQPILKSGNTLEALKFVKALFEDAMPEEVLQWDDLSNNRFMLADEGSLTLNAITITRAGEEKGFPVTDKLWLAPPPKGPVSGFAPAPEGEFKIWKFARNIDLASQFLVDFIGQFRDFFIGSDFFVLPFFPATVPDLAQLLGDDTKANPPDKYQVLTDAVQWSTNLNHPGYNHAAVREIANNWLVSTMFANAASGKMTPEESMTQADQEVRKIFDKWHSLGKV